MFITALKKIPYTSVQLENMAFVKCDNKSDWQHYADKTAEHVGFQAPFIFVNLHHLLVVIVKDCKMLHTAYINLDLKYKCK